MHKDLVIPKPSFKVPKDSHAAEYWKLVRAHGTSRAKMVDFICSIGGYGSHGTRSAIEFNIKDYYSNLDVENLWKLLCSDKMDVGPDPKLPPEHMALAKHLFWRVHAEHEKHLWEWGAEEAYEGWKDSDTPYETFTGIRVNWEWEVHGRSGGHLCMTECGRINTECSEDDLRERLEAKDRYRDSVGRWTTEYDIAHKEVRNLFIICVQNTVDLDHRKISAEIEYRAAWRLWVSFCEDELTQIIDQYEAREDLSEQAGVILSIIEKNYEEHTQKKPDDSVPEIAAFKAICDMAGVKIGE